MNILYKINFCRAKSLSCLFLVFAITLLIDLPAYASPSYADYIFKESGPFYNFDIFLTWDHDVSSSTGIYPAFNFVFQNGVGGYMGTQTDSNGKRALFSIWDDADNSMSAVPVSSNCKRFGGEGTGAQCPLDYPWIAGREYLLRLWELNPVTGGDLWGAWIQDRVTLASTFIGAIQLNNSRGYQGYGWLQNRTSVFLERYISAPPGVCSLQPSAKVTWRGPYANNYDTMAVGAVIAYAQSCSNDNVWSEGYPLISMEDGDAVKRVTQAQTDVWALPISVTISGSGGGAVNSIPSGLACSSTCSNKFTRETILTLLATSDANSIFDGWNGACSGNSNCVLTLNNAMAVTAIFTEADKVRIGLVPYPTLAAAFTNAAYGQIQARAIDFVEMITVTQPTEFKGGWNTTYNNNSGNFTTLYGTLTISTGSIIVEGLEIR